MNSCVGLFKDFKMAQQITVDYIVNSAQNISNLFHPPAGSYGGSTIILMDISTDIFEPADWLCALWRIYSIMGVFLVNIRNMYNGIFHSTH